MPRTSSRPVKPGSRSRYLNKGNDSWIRQSHPSLLHRTDENPGALRIHSDTAAIETITGKDELPCHGESTIFRPFSLAITAICAEVGFDPIAKGD